MSRHSSRIIAWLAVSLGPLALTPVPASAQVQKPNIILIVSDDFGYGDMGVYGGGENRGQPTPALDRIANEGMQFWSFYGQPSCTPGRAAIQTGRTPNRSGMTTVAFQGQGGLPAARLQDVFLWQMAPRRSRLRTSQCEGYDEMKYAGLYHL